MSRSTEGLRAGYAGSSHLAGTFVTQAGGCSEAVIPFGANQAPAAMSSGDRGAAESSLLPPLSPAMALNYEAGEAGHTRAMPGTALSHPHARSGSGSAASSSQHPRGTGDGGEAAPLPLPKGLCQRRAGHGAGGRRGSGPAAPCPPVLGPSVRKTWHPQLPWMSSAHSAALKSLLSNPWALC